MSWMEEVMSLINEAREAYDDFELYINDDDNFCLGEDILTRQEAAEYAMQFWPWLSHVIDGTAYLTTEES